MADLSLTEVPQAGQSAPSQDVLDHLRIARGETDMELFLEQEDPYLLPATTAAFGIAAAHQFSSGNNITGATLSFFGVTSAFMSIFSAASHNKTKETERLYFENSKLHLVRSKGDRPRGHYVFDATSLEITLDVEKNSVHISDGKITERVGHYTEIDEKTLRKTAEILRKCASLHKGRRPWDPPITDPSTLEAA